MSDPINIEDMSDEDFAKMPEPDFDKIAADNSTEEEEDTDDKEEDLTPEEDTSTDDELEDTPEDEEDAGEDDKEEEDGKDDSDEDPNEDQADETDKKEDEEETDTKTAEKDKIDFEAEYKKIMGGFKANGTEITPKSVDDLIRMAQMGVNYHDKMVGIKPARKALKTLENNGLLEDGKLDLLIDVSKGDPAAINKLLKEQGVDPLDINVKDEPNYIPGNNEVSDAELQLDTVLEDLESSPNGNKTLDLVTKQWDADSKKEVAMKPDIMKTINAHMDHGVFDTVQNEVRYRRSVGELVGVSDLEAYRQTGELLNSRGVFDTPATQQKEAVKIPKQDSAKEAKRKADKKAAKTSKSSKAVKRKQYNPLEMSDEDFEKNFDPKSIGIK